MPCLPPADYKATLVESVAAFAVVGRNFPIQSIHSWIVVQRKSLRSGVSFNRSWTEYRDGFGNFTENYWMGNEKLHLLTSSGNWKLRVEVQSNDSRLWYSAEFDHFQISDEPSMYALDVTGYWGDAGNSFASTTYENYYVVGMKFSTFDVDNDLKPGGSCASEAGAGWWFKCCSACLLCSRSARWEGLKAYGSSWTVSASRMMIMSST